MSANKIDMSLDQIIKQNRQEKRQNGGPSQRGRRGRGGGARAGGRGLGGARSGGRGSGVARGAGRGRAGGVRAGRGGGAVVLRRGFGNGVAREGGIRGSAGARAAQQRRLEAMRSALNINRRPALGQLRMQQQRQPRQVVGLARLKQRLALNLIKRARLSKEQQRRIGVVVAPNAAIGDVRQRRAARRQTLGFAGRQLQISGLAPGSGSQRVSGG